MANEKQKWLSKCYKELRIRSTKLQKKITEAKDRLSYCIRNDELFYIEYYSDELNNNRRKLKGIEKEIRIVKQLIRETK